MSENEIKPVAWTSENELKHMATEVDGLMTRSFVGPWSIPLYDQQAIDRLTAERDAAVADARQLRDFVDVEKNALIAAASRARRCLAWACEQRPEFNAEYEALDAAIDAARSEGGV